MVRIRRLTNRRRNQSPEPLYVLNSDGQFEHIEDAPVTLACLQDTWKDCDDLQCKHIQVQGTNIALVFLRGLINEELLEKGIMEPVANLHDAAVSGDSLQRIVSAIPVQTSSELDTVNHAIADGKVVVLVNDLGPAFIVDVGKFPGRSIETSQLEPSLSGPQEAFVEDIHINLALIRKRLRSPQLKVQSLKLGRRTQTTVFVAYFEKIANPEIIGEARARLNRIDVDGILDTNMVREMISDHPYSPFRTSEVTERPDRVVAGLLQGRVYIMVDGAATVIAVPVVFIGSLASSEDYYNNYMVAFQVRVLRHLMYWSSMFLPALYIALLSYNQDLIPTPLLVSLAAQHEGIPFPTVVEALLMVGAFEALREAGVRLPKAVGQSVSIVGALVIGDAAVSANLASPGMVIVVATAGIASFTIPSQDLVNTNRILQFPFMIVASILGLYGIVVLGVALVIYMVSLESFGTPYMTPFAPFTAGEMRDSVIRAPWWAMTRRPQFYHPLDTVRNSTPAPGVKAGNKHE